MSCGRRARRSIGIPYANGPPYAPVDEAVERPESAYSLSKLLGEKMAEQYCRWDPEMKIVGLRFSNVMEPEDYARFPDFDADPQQPPLEPVDLYRRPRRRPGGASWRSKSKLTGAHVFGIANADSVMSRPNDALLDEVFPGTKRKRPITANESLISIDKAREVLGYEPKYPWRDQVEKAKALKAKGYLKDTLGLTI